jgi:hypothetical protein
VENRRLRSRYDFAQVINGDCKPERCYEFFLYTSDLVEGVVRFIPCFGPRTKSERHLFCFRERRALFNTSLINAPGTRAKKIMSLLIESGFIYLGLWVRISTPM